jgi:hypothetical protein
MNDTNKLITMPGGRSIDHATVAAHVMRPIHVQGVISSRGLEEGKKLVPREKLAGTLSFNTDGFVAGLNAVLADNTAGYVMQLRRQGQPNRIGPSQLGETPFPANHGNSTIQCA